MTFTGTKSFGNILELDQDFRFNAVVCDHSLTEKEEGRYWVAVQPSYNGWQTSYAMWLDSFLGEHCANRAQLVQEAIIARELVFETINTPLTSGEIQQGTQVDLKVRIEINHIRTVESGDIKGVRLQLNCCDELVQESQPAQTFAEVVPSGSVDKIYFDF
ncbi:hypothetical protein FZX09_03980 [Synechococcus sp. MU1643]|uniref:hypothetical protein n=1 Tax=Synechococcus sp. MU1643 TaxID=2508349 RepID=UPI001CF8FCEF|nr:hypothetical protein [Synechococcus sp. MU1643]MCB4427972.1 hypothetical protein [Synechococcus sp. MU1643]